MFLCVVVISKNMDRFSCSVMVEQLALNLTNEFQVWGFFMNILFVVSISHQMRKLGILWMGMDARSWPSYLIVSIKTFWNILCLVTLRGMNLVLICVDGNRRWTRNFR